MRIFTLPSRVVREHEACGHGDPLRGMRPEREGSSQCFHALLKIFGSPSELLNQAIRCTRVDFVAQPNFEASFFASGGHLYCGFWVVLGGRIEAFLQKL